VKLHKRILRSALIQAALARLIVLYLRLTFATTRVDRRGDEALDRIIARGRPMLMCYWHGRMGLMHLGWRWPERSCLLISRHRDGTLGQEIARLMGVRVIAGSTRRGGTSAARRMIRELGRQELFIGMMPDGPRGPRMRAGRGVVSMARLAGALIVPIVCSTSRRVVLGSWDRFILPLPFGRAVYLVGEPVDVAEAGDDERARLLVEDRLNALCRQADRLVSVAAIEPAAPTAAGATGEPAA
jgi:lysophospholipid acyltransferase (LPLAT)-like uncharacterized protein